MNALDEAKAAAAALRSANRELVELRGKLLVLQQQDGTSRKECARGDAAGRGPSPWPLAGQAATSHVSAASDLVRSLAVQQRACDDAKVGLDVCVGNLAACRQVRWIDSSCVLVILGGGGGKQQQHLYYLQSVLEQGSGATSSKVQK